MALKPQQYKFIHLMIYENLSKLKAAERVGVHRDTAYDWFKNEEFSLEFRSELQRSLNEVASMAKNRIVELLHADSEAVSLNAAKDILSRAGYDAVDKQEIKAEGIAIKIEYDKD